MELIFKGINNIDALSCYCSIFSYQPPDVSLAVPFNAVHLILVLLVGCAEIGCFGFVCMLSSYQRLLSLLPGQFLLLDLQDHTQARPSLYTHALCDSALQKHAFLL